MIAKIKFKTVTFYTFRRVLFISLLSALFLYAATLKSNGSGTDRYFVSEFVEWNVASQSLRAAAAETGQAPQLPAAAADSRSLGDATSLLHHQLSNTSTNATSASASIFKYLKDENESCRLQQQNSSSSSNQSTTNYCPCLSPYLKGRVIVNESTDISWSDVNQFVNGKGGNGVEWGDVLPDGEWKPGWCTATTRLAVIIPFRDRDSHLKALLRHLIPILQRQLSHFRIFVVEQKSPSIFNKAAMMNVGFQEAFRLFPDMNCVMFQDVDTLVEDDRTLMRCTPGRTPTHYAYILKRWHYSMLYASLFGGVVSMTPKVFRQVNGFSLVYFGWGGEDDDMGYRVRRYYNVTRPPLILGRYTTLGHNRDSNPINELRWKILNKQVGKKTPKIRKRRRSRVENWKYGQHNGLADIKYTAHTVESRPLYTWIHATLSVQGLPYPKHDTFDYEASTGTCPRDSQSITTPRNLSLVTCRFLCDDARRCVGFTYYFLSAADRKLGATASKCVWLRQRCQLQQLQETSNNNSSDDSESHVMTYFKVHS